MLMKSRPLLIGGVVFLLLLLLTQVVVYQRYSLSKEEVRSGALREATILRDNFKTSLSNSLSATRTLSFIITNFGVPTHFDSVARAILASNKYIDALELTRKGVITHVYPFEEHQSVIGFDVLQDSVRSLEAIKAIEKRQLFFAGPFQLKQGGLGVLGRLPIFVGNDFWGFSAVIVRVPTLVRAIGVDKIDRTKFAVQLSKINLSTGKEEFFLPDQFDYGAEDVLAIDIPEGDWKLYVKPLSAFSVSDLLPMALFGLLLSGMSGMFAWHLSRQPAKLNAMVKIKTVEMGKLNRLYRLTSRINQMIVKLKHESEVYNEVCRISVETGRYKMAWVGLINQSERIVTAAAVAGDERDYLSHVCPIRLEPHAYQGPVAKVLSTGKYFYCNDIANDALMSPYAVDALERGYRSSILIPVKKFGDIIGTFNLYSTNINAFDRNEITLLSGIADDITFAIENIAKEQLLQEARSETEAANLMAESIINALPGVFYMYDRDGKFVRWNRNFEMVTGYTAADIERLHPLDLFQGAEKTLLQNRIQKVFETGYGDVIAHFVSKDGVKTPYFFNGTKVTFNGVEYLIGMGIDITDRMKAEQELIKRAREITNLTAYLQQVREEERTHISREIHDVLGQQLTGLKMDSSWLKKRVDHDEAALARIADMMTLIDDTIKTIRRISSQLRPGILDDLGLVAAIDWESNEFTRRTGIKVSFSANATEPDLPEKVATNIFRIFQEALTNIARHSQATEARIDLIFHDGSIELVVTDNGVGMRSSAMNKKDSLGLVGMKERAHQFNGTLAFEPLDPHGTRVRLIIPVNNEAPADYENSNFR